MKDIEGQVTTWLGKESRDVPYNYVPFDEMMKSDPAFLTDSVLCGVLRHCPDSNTRGDGCTNCVGNAPVNSLLEIQPKLRKENLIETLKIYAVLVKG